MSITSLSQSNSDHVLPAPHPPAFPLLHHHARHVLDALCSVVLVMRFPRHIFQVLHVRPHQHVPQQQEVRVVRILH